MFEVCVSDDDVVVCVCVGWKKLWFNGGRRRAIRRVEK